MLKNIALVLAALAVVNAFLFFPFYDSYNNLVARSLGVNYATERSRLIEPYNYLKANYEKGQSFWTDSLYLPYSVELPITGFYEYSEARDMNNKVIRGGVFRSLCNDAEGMEQHIRDRDYMFFIRFDEPEGRKCPMVDAMLDKSEVIYEHENMDIRRVNKEWND